MQGAANDPVAPQRATDIAYQRLLDAIVKLELTPGRLVNERELAEHLGVTRLTLVAALHRIAETGLVSILARRGVLISPVDIRDAQQVFDARLGIEGQIAELAAERATAAQARGLQDLAAQVEPVHDRKNVGHEAFLEVDRRLHMAIAEVARNQYLYDALSRVWNVNLRLWYVFFTERERPDSHLPHHDVVAAIAAHDVSAARHAMQRHILASKELLQSGLWGA